MNFKNCGSLLVTGASRGLGLQIVDSLASGGFSPGKIIATTRNPGSAQVNTPQNNCPVAALYCFQSRYKPWSAPTLSQRRYWRSVSTMEGCPMKAATPRIMPPLCPHCIFVNEKWRRVLLTHRNFRNWQPNTPTSTYWLWVRQREKKAGVYRNK